MRRDHGPRQRGRIQSRAEKIVKQGHAPPVDDGLDRPVGKARARAVRVVAGDVGAHHQRAGGLQRVRLARVLAAGIFVDQLDRRAFVMAGVAVAIIEMIRRDMDQRPARLLAPARQRFQRRRVHGVGKLWIGLAQRQVHDRGGVDHAVRLHRIQGGLKRLWIRNVELKVAAGPRRADHRILVPGNLVPDRPAQRAGSAKDKPAGHAAGSTS